MRAAEAFRALCVPVRSRSIRRPARHLPSRQLLPHLRCAGLQSAPRRLSRMRNCRISARPAGRAFSVPSPLPSARPNRAGGGGAAHAPAFWKSGRGVAVQRSSTGRARNARRTLLDSRRRGRGRGRPRAGCAAAAAGASASYSPPRRIGRGRPPPGAAVPAPHLAPIRRPAM